LGMPVSRKRINIGGWLTRAPSREKKELVEHVSYPNLVGDTMVSEAR